MRPLYILILSFFIGTYSSGQTVSADPVVPYDYDTTLKGGYTIFFKTDDSLQYLYLKKGDWIITELASTSKGILYKNLGYVGADFKYYFVLVHSYGSGNPHYIELIKKATGKNLIKEGAALIDVNEKNEFLLYSDNDVPKPKNKMTLYNVRTGQKQFFNFPKDIFAEREILNRIQIKKISGKHLVIKYDTERGSRTKMYNR